VPRFRVIVGATGMLIPSEGATGFATTRFVRASSELEAAETAGSMVASAVAADPLFAASPPPTLLIDRVVRVRSPLKRSRPNSGYTFVGAGATIEDALDLERKAGSGWLF
jgi:hypothetical protein